MNTRCIWILTFALLVEPLTAHAERVQFAASSHVTFRDCISGATSCDRIGPMKSSRYGGLPGDRSALTSMADPAYGVSTASAEMTGAPGFAKLSAGAVSLPGKRNGANSIAVQRYTNAGASPQRVSFEATLTYHQTVPPENSGFPEGGGSRSGTSVELYLVKLDAEDLEVGTEAEDLSKALMSGPEPGLNPVELAAATSGPGSNATESLTKPFSVGARVEAGESVWLVVLLQSLAADGAVVIARLDGEFGSSSVE